MPEDQIKTEMSETLKIEEPQDQIQKEHQLQEEHLQEDINKEKPKRKYTRRKKTTEGEDTPKPKRKYTRRKKKDETEKIEESPIVQDLKNTKAIIDDVFKEIQGKIDDTLVSKMQPVPPNEIEEPVELTEEELRQGKVKRLSKFIRRYRPQKASPE